MDLQIKGHLTRVDDTVTFDSGFQKRVIIVKTIEQYPQDLKFELVKNNVDQVEGLDINDIIDVHFNLRGNEYQGKHYVNVQAWKLVKDENTTASAGGVTGEVVSTAMDQESDDLPF